MSANNNSFKEIANRYSIPEDQISRILESIKIKSSAKPSDEQLRGFEKVCQMVQSGMELDVAVQSIHEEAKNNNKTQKENDQVLPAAQAQLKAENGMNAQFDDLVFEQAERAADFALAELPQIALEQRQHYREKFIQRFRQHIVERLQDPSYQQQFQAVIEGKEMGKLPILLESPTSNTALLSSSSSSS